MKRKLLYLCMLTSFIGGVLPTYVSAETDYFAEEVQAEGIEYFDSSSWNDLKDKFYNYDYAKIETAVVTQGKALVFDFSNERDLETKERYRDLLKKILGVSFEKNFLVITQYKEKLLYTPLDNKGDALELARNNLNESTKAQLADTRSGFARASRDELVPPQIAFYVNLNKKITYGECSFPYYPLFFGETESTGYCEKPSINLIYKVVFERSLKQDENLGNTLPDKKIVRISLDDTTTSQGITVNPKLETFRYIKNGVHGWYSEWASSAIAQDYTFSFTASNDKATILKTTPEKDQPTGYEGTISSDLAVGVANKNSDPKVPVSVADLAFEDRRMLTYDNRDYRVARTQEHPQEVKFWWIREKYANADSLLTRRTSSIFWEGFPADLSRIDPISYKKFIPKTDVIFQAAPDAEGETKFALSASVNIRPFYHRSFNNAGFYFSFYGYDGDEKRISRRVSVAELFSVDWGNPIFTGATAVNLKLGGLKNQCVNIELDSTMSTSECDITSKKQSFVYDQQNRFASVSHPGLCIDAKNLHYLESCSADISQSWKWAAEGNRLASSLYAGMRFLGYDKQTGGFEVSETPTAQISQEIFTEFTKLNK